MLAQTQGSGIGLGSTIGEVVNPGFVDGIASGGGIGLGCAEALLTVLAQAQGSGVGTLAIEASLRSEEFIPLIEEIARLRARVIELELALKSRAHFRI